MVNDCHMLRSVSLAIYTTKTDNCAVQNEKKIVALSLSDLPSLTFTLTRTPNDNTNYYVYLLAQFECWAHRCPLRFLYVEYDNIEWVYNIFVALIRTAHCITTGLCWFIARLKRDDSAFYFRIECWRWKTGLVCLLLFKMIQIYYISVNVLNLYLAF